MTDASTKEDAVTFLTQCADSQGIHWSRGVKWEPEECPICSGSNDAGWLGTPGSRYGHNSRECAPVAYAAAVVLSGETGEPLTYETLDYVMGLVVNNHDDPEDLIRDYGREYGIDPDQYLEPEDEEE